MKLNNIKLLIDEIKNFCDLWNVIEFALFGSVLRKYFPFDSDIDVMVQYHLQVKQTFYNLEEMEILEN